MSDGGSTTGEPTTGEPTTGPTTGEPTTGTTGEPTTGEPTTGPTTTEGETTTGTTTGEEIEGPDICGIEADDLVFSFVEEVNNSKDLGDPVLLRDGLTLVVEDGGDFKIMTRTNAGSPFSAPKEWSALSALNSSWTESKITFSTDGLEVYFSRESDFQHDIWHAKRANTAAAFGNLTLVQEVSSNEDDWDPHLSQDRKRLYLAPEVGVLNQDILVAHRSDKFAMFGSPQPVDGINGPDIDADPALSEDELVMIFVSNRESLQEDLFIATRNSIDEGFEGVTKMGAPLNEGNDRVADVFIADLPMLGICELYFVSDRNFPGRHIYRAQISSKN